MNNLFATGWVITWHSPKVILMAKSEICAIHIWHAIENLVCQRAGRRENDFAISSS
jgi:hypothetical protein